MEFWQPERSLAGKTVTIIGGGPSHAAVDLAALKGHRFAAINSACRKVRPIATDQDILYFTDNSWAEQHEGLILDWPGIVVCVNSHAKRRLGDLVRYIDIVGLTARTGVVPPEFGQMSSGHSLVCLLQEMGARRVVLVGFECQSVDGRTHGHHDYVQTDMQAFDQFLAAWRGLARFLTVETINATPNSRIDCFQVMDLEEAVQ